ncbi:alpha/beta hydrolase [Lapidilactobacillus achengensis]|uniref:Alpha/beta hydrolase n=1 Tax=Lapidilactobacillus achengensis TaxID=2486000 RepID=A0ABW1UNV4_9LACO|nr:alpha/beta fold hydrolase [Lapidilactobacillus achengensis]
MVKKWPQPLYLPGTKTTGVLLLHAYTGSSSDMRLLAQALNRAGYGVNVPHLTGHATAEPLDILTKGNPDAWWANTQNGLEFLQGQGYQRLAVFGLSLGGVFATKAVLENPLVSGGGTISAPLMTTDFARIGPEFLNYARKIYQLTQVPTAEIAPRLQEIGRLLPIQLASVQAFIRPLQAELPTDQKPFFVAQGGADQLIDPQAGPRLQAALPPELVDFHWYPEAGHVLTVNSAHQQLEQDILAFLAGL